MKVHELAKKTGKKSKELLQELGLKSHMSMVPEDVVSEYLGSEKKISETESQGTATIDSAETVVIEEANESRSGGAIPGDIAEECPYGLKEIELKNRYLGSKSPCWKWRHLIG